MGELWQTHGESNTGNMRYNIILIIGLALLTGQCSAKAWEAWSDSRDFHPCTAHERGAEITTEAECREAAQQLDAESGVKWKWEFGVTTSNSSPRCFWKQEKGRKIGAFYNRNGDGKYRPLSGEHPICKWINGPLH